MDILDVSNMILYSSIDKRPSSAKASFSASTLEGSGVFFFCFFPFAPVLNLWDSKNSMRSESSMRGRGCPSG